jgi:hypothetical protein
MAAKAKSAINIYPAVYREQEADYFFEKNRSVDCRGRIGV